MAKVLTCDVIQLALRAGNEKDEDQADTVGCCSLRVEHIQLHEEKDGEHVLVSKYLLHLKI
jgi:DNA topoisomerase-1